MNFWYTEKAPSHVNVPTNAQDTMASLIHPSVWLPVHITYNQSVKQTTGQVNLRSKVFSEFLRRFMTSITWDLMLGQMTSIYTHKHSFISFIMSVCLSVFMEQLGSHWTDFHEIFNFSIFRKSVDQFQIWLKYHKNDTYFTGGPVYVYDISLSSS